MRMWQELWKEVSLSGLACQIIHGYDTGSKYCFICIMWGKRALRQTAKIWMHRLTPRNRDLLVRHEKLVHSHESSKDARNNSTASANVQMSPPSVITAPNLIDPDLLIAQTQHYSNVDLNAGRTQETMMHHRTPGCSLDLLSDAANHLASSDMHMTPSMPPMQLENRGHQEPMHYGNTISEQAPMRNSRYSAMPPNGPIEDYNFFLDDSGMSNYFLPSSAFDPELPVSWGSRPDLQQQNSGGDYHLRPPQQEVPQDDNNSFSRFGSRLPSLQPEFHDPSDGSGRGQEDASRSGPPWRISGQDHREIQIKLDDFASVLPKGFVLPSRHTLSRFLEGYINGFHEHLPFLHIPTIRAVNLAPELLLALVAVGAQYRFESHRGNGLWYAARAIAVEQVRRRNSQQVLDILSPSTYGSESVVVSPVSGYRHMENSGRHDSRGTLDGTEIVQNDPRYVASPVLDVRLTKSWTLLVFRLVQSILTNFRTVLGHLKLDLKPFKLYFY